MIDKFSYLKYSLALILTFVGVKLMLHEVWKPEEWVSLVVIFGTLAAGVLISLLRKPPADHVDDPTQITAPSHVPEDHQV